MIAETFWNGEPCVATKVVLMVEDDATFPNYWARDLVGEHIDAVEVVYNGQTFYINDQGGAGWRKVTDGSGSSRYGHKSLRGEVIARSR